MKFFTNKEITKKIIIVVLLVMSFNFITPVASQAVPRGGKLFEPLFQLICAIGDLFMAGMQKIFMGYGDIKEEIETDTSASNTKFNIVYSPGVIFSNKVPALDVNFFTPKEDLTLSIAGEPELKELKQINEIPTFDVMNNPENPGIEGLLKEYIPEKVSEYGYEYDKITKLSTDNKIWYKTLQTFLGHLSDVEFYTWKSDEKEYGIKIDVTQYPVGQELGIKYNGTVYELIPNVKTGETRKSSAATLQQTVATWYKALRAFALVGLLSVLVYIGIRILISSTGPEKAKYKKMIIDWIAAVCILFVLQYIMVFTLKITNKLIDIFSVEVIETDSNGNIIRDNLISDLRGKVGGDDETEIDYTTLESFIHTIMYIALVIETGIFSIHYLKRLVYMAFFTMIAPLIALTYPLDKIKDGQAQAFGTWIREYVFNALIQPVHLLLYYIFITSARDLATGNPLYAVVALGFMMPAEKFFRKMFGFEKASSVSQVGAAAGGALVMNAINKMGQRAGHHAAGKGGSGAGTAGGSTGGSTPRYISNPGGTTPGGTPPLDSNGDEIGTAGRVFGNQQVSGAQYGIGNTGNGLRTLSGHYFNSGNFGKNGKVWKTAGRGIRKGAVGLAGAATLGTVGLAAGVATGDMGNAIKYGAVGAGAGYMGANAIGDRAATLEKTNREIYKEGKWGTEEYNTRNSIKELTSDNDFNRVCKDLGIKGQEGKEALIRQFHSNGITKAQDIKKAMNVRASNPGTSQNEIVLAQKIRQEASRYGMKKKDIENDLRGRGLSQSQVTRAMNLIDQL